MRAGKCLEYTRCCSLICPSKEVSAIRFRYFVLQKSTLLYFSITLGSLNSLQILIGPVQGEMVYGFRIVVNTDVTRRFY